MMRVHQYPTVEAPDFLLEALELSNDAVVIVDGDLRISYFNAAAELIWGLDRAEVLGGDASRLGLGDLRAHDVAAPAAPAINGEDPTQGRGAEIRI